MRKLWGVQTGIGAIRMEGKVNEYTLNSCQLTLEWSSTPMSFHRSIFALEMFPSSFKWCRCLADTATRCTFWLNVNISGIHQAHTFLKNKCPWIRVSILPTLVPLLDAISLTVICLVPRNSSLTQWMFTLQLANCGHEIGLRLLCSLQKTYYTDHGHLHVTGSLPHTVRLTYE